MSNYRDLLVKMVKAAGQDIADRAEDLVGNSELMTNFSIRIDFPQGYDVVPKIEVYREFVSKKSLDVYVNEKENKNA